ncbi:MAG: aminotransferase class V-fold PLP-dependent enzyme, partial [Myxococcota bacterium]
RRPGTENVASIVGLGTACRIAASDLNRVAAQVRQRRDELWQRLAASIPGILINGHPTDRLPNTLNVRFPNVSGLAILAAAPQIAASTGSACHAGQESASSVILDLGSSEREALGSVRLSLGRETSQDEVERAANALIQAWRQVVPAAPKARLPTANSTLSG